MSIRHSGSISLLGCVRLVPPRRLLTSGGYSLLLFFSMLLAKVSK
uniref:Uncharacterized protein n=1 Tax=Arundo donax TaxID=35708 RepID=A0A0A9G1B6_ARUDO